MKDPRTICIIDPEYGGAYGWGSRNGDENRPCASNHADDTGWHGDHPISDELHRAFVAWQSEFERSRPDPVSRVVMLNWADFHARGLALTHLLKGELADAARVYCFKPWEDPMYRLEERREVLLDGATRVLPAPSNV